MPSDSDPDSEVNSRSGKVIVLREHQAAERILDELLSTDPTTHDFNARLARSALIGTPLLAAIVRRLDAFQPRRLDVLGRVVAVYPDSVEAAHSLRRTANDRRTLASMRARISGDITSGGVAAAFTTVPGSCAPAARPPGRNNAANRSERLLGLFVVSAKNGMKVVPTDAKHM